MWDVLKLIDVRLRLVPIAIGSVEKTLNNWVDDYLKGGFDELLKAKQSGKKGKGQLTGNSLRVFKHIILHKSPNNYEDYGLIGYVWTLDKMQILL